MNRHTETLTTISQDLAGVRRARIAAGIVYKGRLVAVGVNSKKSHPFQAKYSKNEHAIYLHAEVAAIMAAKRKLTEAELAKATLYVIRTKESYINGQTVLGIAKPCEGCERCINDHNIRRVVYSMDCEVTTEKKFVMVEKSS